MNYEPLVYKRDVEIDIDYGGIVFNPNCSTKRTFHYVNKICSTETHFQYRTKFPLCKLTFQYENRPKLHYVNELSIT